MQVSVESPSKLQRRVTITVPVEKLDAAIDSRLAKLAKTAKIKGFRPGAVPVAHIKKLYGEAARQEALSDVIQSSLYEALTQEKLNPVAAPSVEPKNITPGQPIEFIATFEVLPEIEDVNFKGGALEKLIPSVTTEDIDKVVDRLRDQHTTWKEVDRAAKEKDQAVIDFRGSIDGKFFQGGEAHDYPIIIGSKTMIPGFEEGVVGLKKGDEKVIKVTFPAEYFAKEVAGKEAEFTINVRKVSEPEVQEINADLVKKLGIQSGDIEELRSEIKKNLERECERLVAGKLKNKVFDLLMEQNLIEVPESLIEQEANRIHNEMHPHHKGHDHGHTKEEMAQFNDAAKRNVVLGLLVGKLIRQHNLNPDKARVQEHIAKMSSAYEKPEDVIKWYNSDKRRLAEIEMLILEDQVLEKLLESATLTEKKVSYSELVKS